MSYSIFHLDVPDFNVRVGLETTHLVKPRPLHCVQWFKNGDHPQDRVSVLFPEGSVVKPYRFKQDPAGNDVCKSCGKSWAEHGWIEGVPQQQFFVPKVCPGDWVCHYTDEASPKLGYFIVPASQFERDTIALPKRN